MNLINNQKNLEKRNLPREISETLTLEIKLTFPKDTTLIKNVEEINKKGLSFSMFENEGFFDKNEILKDMKIFDKDLETIIPKSEVVYKEPYEINGIKKYKIGIKFLVEENEFKKRPKRFEIKSINNVNTKIFFNIGDEIYRGQLLNFSKYGALILVKSPKFVIKKSETLKDFTISIEEKNVYKGNVIISDIEQKLNDLKIRIYVKEGFIPVDEILNISNINKLDFVIEKINEENLILQNLPKEYKDEVNELCYKLKILKKVLDEFEESIKDEEPKARQKIENEMLENIDKNFSNEISNHLHKINNLTKNINIKDEIYIKYLKYFQNELNDYLLLSPFINRIYSKPLGYAGDYQMMNMIYKNIPQGKSLFAKILDKYTLNILVAQANRNRIPYMINKIKNKGFEILKTKSRIKITSIACGPCLEIQELMKNEELSNHIDFTLLDSSKEALEYAKKQLEFFKDKYKRTTTFKFINESIYPLIKNKNVQNLIDNDQDIVYSLGLFEYLSDITVIRLLKVLYEKLSKKGTLIVGNYDDLNDNKSYMELGGEWFLFYREPEEMISFTKGITDCKVFTETDNKIEFNKFLNIEKEEIF